MISDFGSSVSDFFLVTVSKEPIYPPPPMPQWSAIQSVDRDVYVHLKCEYDDVSGHLLLSLIHEDVLDEEVWRWRLATGQLANVAVNGGAVCIPIDGLPTGDVVLEPDWCITRCLLRWMHWGDLRLSLTDQLSD